MMMMKMSVNWPNNMTSFRLSLPPGSAEIVLNGVHASHRKHSQLLGDHQCGLQLHPVLCAISKVSGNCQRYNLQAGTVEQTSKSEEEEENEQKDVREEERTF